MRGRSGEDDLALDDRVEFERGGPFDERRIAEIDLIAELVARVPELERRRVLFADRGDAPRTCPERGRHAALARDRADDAAECHVGQQAPERPVAATKPNCRWAGLALSHAPSRH